MARKLSWRGLMSFDSAGDGRPAPITWRPAADEAPPRSIVEASRLMLFGAVLNLLEIPRALLTRDDLRRAFDAEARAQGSRVNAQDLDRVVALSLSITTIVAVGSAVVWFLMSRSTLRGSVWGRWIACVLLLLGFIIFFGGLLPTAGLFARVFAAALLLVGVWSVVRLWHRDSSAWIRYRTKPQE